MFSLAGLEVVVASVQWAYSNATLRRLQVFVNNRLQRIVYSVHTGPTKTNKELWKKTEEEPAMDQFERSKWN